MFLFIFLFIPLQSVFAKPANLSTKNTTTEISLDYIDLAIENAALKVGVPKHLLKAVCAVESNLRPHSFVYNDGGDLNHAFGLCQVLRKTAEEYLGRSLKQCSSDFRVPSGPSLERKYANCELFGPKTNAYVAALVLKSKIDRYNGHIVKATAAYNTGSLKYCGPSGWATSVSGKKLYRCEKGDLINRTYVNRVHAALAPYTFENMKVDLVYKG